MHGSTNIPTPEVVFEGLHCTLTIQRPMAGTVLAIFKGPDIGEFGQAPFRELSKDLDQERPLELFIDALDCLGPSIQVSNEWSQWMCAHRANLHRVNILCGSKLVEVTAKFVRSFTEFGDRMRIYTDRASFYRALHE